MNKLRLLLFSGCMLLHVSKAFTQTTSGIWLDDLNIKSFSEGIPAVLGKTNASGDSMLINGAHYKRGVGVNSTSILAFFLNGNAAQSVAAKISDLAYESYK